MKGLIVFFIAVICSECVVLPRIPPHLVECYRGGGPALPAPRRLDVFLSLIRRLEADSTLDMRLFSTNILKSLRLDGIEEAANFIETEILLPFRASAFQFHRYKLLMDLFIPSQYLLDVDESLSTEEKCMLHKMMSSAVRPWQRGDENIVCPLSATQRQNMAQTNRRSHSRCPIEDGVIQTDWGTISPGTVVAAVAAALESQRVLVTDILTANVYKEEIAQQLVESALEEWVKKNEKYEEQSIGDVEVEASGAEISNLWVATLAGDLAEVVVNQGPRVGASPQRLGVGSSSRWNDTLLPRDHYLLLPNSTAADWHFTDAEILAGIDGLILAKYISAWVEQRRTLRLSQVIEMYYSNEGVSFEPSVRACNRQALFLNIIDRNQLLMEASRFAHILSLRQITVYMPFEEMRTITEAAVTAFINYIPSLLRASHRECGAASRAPAADLLVATDAAWPGHDVERFMAWIGGAFEVDAERSTMGLLHGNTGQWIVPPATNLTGFFGHLYNSTVDWPNRLNLPNVISAVTRHARSERLRDIARRAGAGRSILALVVSATDRPSASELERARDLMASLRNSFFDVYFAYAAQDLTDFKNINYEYLDYSELFIKLPSKTVQDTIQAVNTYLTSSAVPKRIFGAQCPMNGTVYEQIPYEDYVIPGREHHYRIHPYYLQQQPLINVEFRNSGHGSVLVCAWRGAARAQGPQRCYTLPPRAAHAFNLSAPCASPRFCPPAHFALSAVESLNQCANKDCRLPHQVGYYIRHSGARCLPLLGSTAPDTTPQLNLLLSLVIFVILLPLCSTY